jgi:hypothetical protein
VGGAITNDYQEPHIQLIYRNLHCRNSDKLILKLVTIHHTPLLTAGHHLFTIWKMEETHDV